nr:hypothetical protein [Agromyces laixinhei]
MGAEVVALPRGGIGEHIDLEPAASVVAKHPRAPNRLIAAVREDLQALGLAHRGGLQPHAEVTECADLIVASPPQRHRSNELLAAHADPIVGDSNAVDESASHHEPDADAFCPRIDRVVDQVGDRAGQRVPTPDGAEHRWVGIEVDDSGDIAGRAGDGDGVDNG